MKRKAIILVLVVLGSAIMLTARNNNSNEEKRFDNKRDYNGRMTEDFFKDSEISTISGKITLVNGELPKVTSGGVTYTLMAPWFDLEDLTLTNGETITVKGVEMNRRLQWDNKEKNLVITEITINGKTTEINHDEHFNREGRGQGRMPRNMGRNHY